MEHFDALNQYVNFLWTQMQYDWSIFSNPWVLYPVLPAVFYLLFFIVKWYVLLAPITVPITTLTHGLNQGKKEPESTKDKIRDQFSQLLKG